MFMNKVERKRARKSNKAIEFEIYMSTNVDYIGKLSVDMGIICKKLKYSCKHKNEKEN